jgi:hypothetical protein
MPNSAGASYDGTPDRVAAKDHGLVSLDHPHADGDFLEAP